MCHSSSGASVQIRVRSSQTKGKEGISFLWTRSANGPCTTVAVLVGDVMLSSAMRCQCWGTDAAAQFSRTLQGVVPADAHL